MISNFLARAAAAALVSASLDANAHEIGGQDLGQVKFGTSCDAKVQPIFERGVALLHSFWFAEAGKTFDAVIAQDPDCAIAYWGLAVNISSKNSRLRVFLVDRFRPSPSCFMSVMLRGLVRSRKADQH